MCDVFLAPLSSRRILIRVKENVDQSLMYVTRIFGLVCRRSKAVKEREREREFRAADIYSMWRIGGYVLTDRKDEVCHWFDHERSPPLLS